ncbi:CobW family GTP-binding protein [Shewanella waksmanii]|uniref:CobW family GTP-binding protein n=1 Tax=Shewanella waksmanii TaxID=213783 RepID=UPI0037356150
MIIQAIATNVITGFLGVGKTSFIKQLLASKPANERWAVLVNEFGEIGIDGKLLASNDGEVHIKEVPGGCLCCAAGVPFQVAITELIRRSKPDRLLIEPTGLGHPKAMIKLLQQSHLASTIKVEQTVCLVDATKVTDNRYTEHEIFQQQVDIADIVLAAKSDTYQADELQQLAKLLARWQLTPSVVPFSHKDLSSEAFEQQYAKLVNGKSQRAQSLLGGAQSVAEKLLSPSSIFAERSPKLLEFDANGYFHCSNQHDGFTTASWAFDVSYEFDFDAIVQWVKSLDVLRLKAVLITNEGIAALNYVDGQLSMQELDDVMDSRLEIITEAMPDWSQLDKQLLATTQRLG